MLTVFPAVILLPPLSLTFLASLIPFYSILICLTFLPPFPVFISLLFHLARC